MVTPVAVAALLLCRSAGAPHFPSMAASTANAAPSSSFFVNGRLEVAPVSYA